MIGALQTLGLDIDGDGTDLTVGGRAGPAAPARIDCGLAGTVLRFVPPMAALSTAAVEFDGDDQARARPIAPLLDALRGLGVDIEGTGLPFLVRGHGSVRGGTVHIDASASSQFVSGLLLSGASFRTGLTLVHTGTSVPSAPHIAMTVEMLRQAGVDGRRLGGQPVAGAARPGRAATLARRTRPVELGAVPGRGRGHRRGGAHHRLAERERAAGRNHPRHPQVGRIDCAPDGFVPRGAGRSRGYPGFDVDLHDVGELAPVGGGAGRAGRTRLGVAADRDRAPARPRDRPAGRAEYRDQRAGR